MRKITYFQEHNSLYKAIHILFRQINKIVDKNLCTSIYGLLFKAFLKKKCMYMSKPNNKENSACR